MSRTRFIRVGILLTFLIVVIQSAWAVSMPGFRGPDEPHHVNSVMRIAGGGGWPAPGEAMLDPVVHTAGREAGLLRVGGAPFTSTNRTTLLNPRVAGFPFERVGVTPHEDRTSIAATGFNEADAVEIDQMTQHPPLYYAGGALVVHALDLEDEPWDRVLLALRLYGIALTIPLVPATIYTARRLGASRHWSLAAGFLPLAIPQLFGITSVVTNDSLAIGTGALVIAALAKAATEKVTWKTVLLVGGSLGLALWSKGLVLALGLPLILVFLFAKNESWRTRILAALASGTMALVIGWWWIHNIIRYGVLQPAGYSRPTPEGWDASDAQIFDYGLHAFRTFTRSFFSSFGWLDVNFPGLITILLLTLFIGATVWSVMRAGEARTTYLILLSPFIGLLVLLYVQGWLNHLATAAVAGVQGRYLYPTLAAFGGIVLGLRVFGRRGYRCYGLIAIATGMFGFAWLLRHAYPGGSWINFDRLAYVAGLPTGIIIILFIAYLAANAVLVWLVFRWSAGAHLPAEPQQAHGVAEAEIADAPAGR